jgi:phosphoglycerate dehydrogenase-like enzyme
METKTALILLRAEDAYKKRLEVTLAGYNIIYADDEAAVSDAETSNVELIFGFPAPATLARYPALKWIQLFLAGIDAYKAHAGNAGIVITNASGAYGQSVSEHMTACTLALVKRLHQYRDEQNKGLWHQRGGVTSVKGAVVLVAGLGDIGGEFARQMKALGAYVIGVRRARVEAAKKPDYADELILSTQLDDALPRADIVASVLPNTSTTAGLFSRERLAKMKHGAYLINAGRGNAVDADALCDALDSGALAGAALDVTDPEPLPAGHRLWRTENVLLTPHVSGGFNLPQTYKNVWEIFLDNAARYVKGGELRNVADFELGYRKM